MAQQRYRRQFFFAQEVECAGQQYRHGAGLLHRDDVGFLQVFQMVDRECAMACRQLRGAQVGQLLGMNLDRQAEPGGGVEYAFGLRDREADVFAEDVDRIDQALCMQCRQHLLAYQRDVVVGAAVVFRRQRVRAEKSRDHADRIADTEAARHAQYLAFGRQVEAVARFYFYRRDAFGQQGFQPARRLREEGFFIGAARRPHCRHDAATALCDFFVTGAGQPQRKFVGAIAAVHQVRVAVDQAGRDPLRREVVAVLDRRKFRRQCIIVAEPGNHAVTHRDRAAFDDVVWIAARRNAGVVPNAVATNRAHEDSRLVGALAR